MTFSFLSPFATALLAVLVSVALVAMYFLKLRHRRLVISSSMVWSKVLERREERSLGKHLRRLLSILLTVAIGLLLVLAVARPDIQSLTGTARRTMIVLDTSPSMLARMNDGKTRWQHAADTAKELIDESPSSAEFRIADTSGQYNFPFTREKA